MPYIKQDQRDALHDDICSLVLTMNSLSDTDNKKGIFNYVVTMLSLGVIGDELKYGKINDVVGAMECCKMELYRRLGVPYEEEKILQNGDVYPEIKEDGQPNYDEGSA